MVASPPSWVVSLASALLCAASWPTAACCVAPPRAQDLLSVGFRTPEQTFATFQTAVRADDLTSQRRCLSADFVDRNHLSELTFRESWEQLREDQPFLRKGIADARLASPPEVRGSRARVVAESHGRRLEVDLVLEDFCEAWTGGARAVDELAPFAARTGVQEADDGTTWFFGRMPLPRGIERRTITEIRVGREWKIDGFEMVEEDTPGSAPTESHP